MMGGKRVLDDTVMDNLYPSLDITLGSIEPSFIAWDDEKDVVSNHEIKQSPNKEHPISANDIIIRRKAALNSEEPGHVLNSLSLKEQEKVRKSCFCENMVNKMYRGL
jgi:hypothetical protein